MHFIQLLLIYVHGSFCGEQSQYHIMFFFFLFFFTPALTCEFTVIGGCLRERAPPGAACCMIISVFSSGKHEQKSLRDREGPHGSPVLLLGPVWRKVYNDTHTLRSPVARPSIQVNTAPWRVSHPHYPHRGGGDTDA